LKGYSYQLKAFIVINRWILVDKIFKRCQLVVKAALTLAMNYRKTASSSDNGFSFLGSLGFSAFRNHPISFQVATTIIIKDTAKQHSATLLSVVFYLLFC
jgi:hypothetical protein